MIQQHKKGFTIVELMLAMTLVSILLVAVASAIIHMSSIMTKSKTMKELNSVGRVINSDFTRIFNSMEAIYGWNEVNPSSSASRNSVYVKLPNGSGAFCSGVYSYVWNSASSLNNANQPSAEVPFRYAGVGVNDTSIRLIRIRDNARQYCSNERLWSQIPNNSLNVTNLLPLGETGLMIYDINFRKVHSDVTSNQSFINIQYVLGTKNDNGQINTFGLSCNPSAQYRDYCSINRFDLNVRTMGRR